MLLIPLSIVSFTITGLCIIKKGCLVRGDMGYTTLSSNEETVVLAIDNDDNDDYENTLQFRR